MNNARGTLCHIILDGGLGRSMRCRVELHPAVRSTLRSSEIGMRKRCSALKAAKRAPIVGLTSENMALGPCCQPPKGHAVQVQTVNCKMRSVLIVPCCMEKLEASLSVLGAWRQRSGWLCPTQRGMLMVLTSHFCFSENLGFFRASEWHSYRNGMM